MARRRRKAPRKVNAKQHACLIRCVDRIIANTERDRIALQRYARCRQTCLRTNKKRRR